MFATRFAPRSIWDAFEDMQRILDHTANGFTGHPGRWGAEQPPLDVQAGDDRVVVSAELPGFTADAVEVTVENDTLTISGERQRDVPEGAKVLREERGAYRFNRSVRLPYPVDAESAEARFQNGVLVVALQRSAADKPHRVTVSAA